MSYPIPPILIEILKLLFAICLPSNILQEVEAKEVIKEQPTPTNLSATARRVLQCTRSQ